MAYKSKYKPKNPHKYVGNPDNIICRSLWERTFCKYLDENTNVIRWSSEELQIPYISPMDNRPHMYYPDFLFEVKKDSSVETLVVEIKPEKQTKPPTESPNKKQKTIIYERYQFAVNSAKWKAAQEWCKSKGYTFLILKEKHLN
jgi:hypothetical protein